MNYTSREVGSHYSNWQRLVPYATTQRLATARVPSYPPCGFKNECQWIGWYYRKIYQAMQMRITYSRNGAEFAIERIPACGRSSKIKVKLTLVLISTLVKEFNRDWLNAEHVVIKASQGASEESTGFASVDIPYYVIEISRIHISEAIEDVRLVYR